jgi:hypothetical protein
MGGARTIVGTLLEPVATFRALAEAPKAWIALVVVVLAHLSVPLALAGRIDARAAAIEELGPKIAESTDRELAEAVEQKVKISEVALVARGVMGPPMLALELTIVLWLWGRYLRGKPAFGALYAMAAHAQLPLAIRSLGRAGVILSRTAVEPKEVDGLLPSGLETILHVASPWKQLLGGADLFLLWTAVLLGVALYAAGKLPARRAAVGMALAYAAFIAVFLVGLPGLSGA